MLRLPFLTAVHPVCCVLMLGSITAGPVGAQISSSGSQVGRVEFDFEGAPAATIEVDLSRGMLSDVAGIGRAAIGGIAEALLEGASGHGDGSVQESAEYLRAVNQIVEALTGVVHEVRVRVYEDLPDGSLESRSSMIAHYQEKLRGTDWDNVVRVREDDANVTVCALRRDGAIRGLFVVAAEDDELVMVNVVCELTPERVKQVTNQATKIGLKVGLEQAIQDGMRNLHRHHH